MAVLFIFGHPSHCRLPLQPDLAGPGKGPRPRLGIPARRFLTGPAYSPALWRPYGVQTTKHATLRKSSDLCDYATQIDESIMQGSTKVRFLSCVISPTRPRRMITQLGNRTFAEICTGWGWWSGSWVGLT